MKKKLALLLLSLSLLLSACSSSTETASDVTEETTSDASTEQPEDETSLAEPDAAETDTAETVESEEELDTIEVTLPENINEITYDEIEKLKQEDGYVSITRNEDQSITYVLTIDKQKELLENLETKFASFVDSIPGSNDYPTITKLEVTDDFSKFTITTTATSKEELLSNEIVLATELYSLGKTYRGYASEKDTTVTIEYLCDSTGEMIASSDSPNLEDLTVADTTDKNDNVAETKENTTSTKTTETAIKTESSNATTTENTTTTATSAETNNDTTSSAAQNAASSTTETASGSGNENNFNTYDNKEQQQTTANYVLNTNTMKIHYPSCSSVAKIAPQNYSTSNQSVAELQAQGYTTCGRCFK